MNSILQSIPLHTIRTKPQVRKQMKEEDQTSLAQSIQHNGVLVPLLGHREKEEIILDDGHRRLDAAKRAELETIPMIVSDHILSPAERITFQLLANAHRRDLEITDHARAIKALMQESNFTASEISIKLGGPSPATISKLLAILVLPRPVQNLVDCGKLPMSSAYTIATVKDSVQREHLIEEVLAGRMTRDRLVKHVKAKRNVKKTTPKPTRKRVPKERLTIQLGLGRSIIVSAPSMTVEQVSSWLVGLAAQLKGVDKENRSLGEVVKIISDTNQKSIDDLLSDCEES